MTDHVLKTPDQFTSPPTIALYMVVKNASSVIERTLKHVAPYISELVIVMNDTTDDTESKIFECHKRYFKKGSLLTLIHVRWADSPCLYFTDTRLMYLQGPPFRNEEYFGPFTEKPLLCNWSGLRNLGWRHKTDCQWKLFLDADDTIQDPESLYGVCDLLDHHGADLGLSLYRYNIKDGEVYGQTYRERLVKNKPEIKWTGDVHETITGHEKAVIISGNLVVTDNKDNKGEGTRTPDRDFKVLYRKGRLNNWNLTPMEFLLIGKEISFKMPSLAIEFLRQSFSMPDQPPQMRAYNLRLQGIIYDTRLNSSACAGSLFLESMKIDPSPKVAFMACSSFYKSEWYDDVVKLYEVGCLLEGKIFTMDEGPGHKKTAQMAVEVSLSILNCSLSITLIHEAVISFPSDISIKTLDQEIQKCLFKK